MAVTLKRSIVKPTYVQRNFLCSFKFCVKPKTFANVFCSVLMFLVRKIPIWIKYKLLLLEQDTLLRGKLNGKLRRHTPSEAVFTRGHCPIIDQSICCQTYKLMTHCSYQPIEIVHTFKNSCKNANLFIKLQKRFSKSPFWSTTVLCILTSHQVYCLVVIGSWKKENISFLMQCWIFVVLWILQR